MCPGQVIEPPPGGGKKVSEKPDTQAECENSGSSGDSVLSVIAFVDTNAERDLQPANELDGWFVTGQSDVLSWDKVCCEHTIDDDGDDRRYHPPVGGGIEKRGKGGRYCERNICDSNSRYRKARNIRPIIRTWRYPKRSCSTPESLMS